MYTEQSRVQLDTINSVTKTLSIAVFKDVLKDGVIIASSPPWRSGYNPLELEKVVADLTAQAPDYDVAYLESVLNAMWTQEVKDAYLASLPIEEEE
jgi:hypothetical protein